MREGIDGLEKEVKQQLENISQRNLGRDDRVASDHGICSRFPFLDEEVVSFLKETSIFLKADLRFERNVGAKLLLRAAANKLKLKITASEAKRAIQFGSRIAKLDGVKKKGHEKVDKS